MIYHFKVKKSKDGYWAQCLELKGCRTQGETLEELKVNMNDALNLYLAESEDSSVLFAMPKSKAAGKSILEVEVDPSVAIAMMIRQARLRMKKTQKEMMSFLEIKTLSNYQRLEDPSRANPELKTLVKLTKAIPDLSLARLLDSYKVGKKKAG
jgi:antitoxin HicB